MKSKDQILLESIYSKKVLKEDFPKIPGDGYADGGEPYDDDELETMNNKEQSFDYDSVHRAISRRIASNHVDLLRNYGIKKVLDAVNQVASQVVEGESLEDIGSSGVSAWVNWVVKDLTRGENTAERLQNMSDTWNKNASPEAKAGKEKLSSMMGEFGNRLGPEGAY